MRDTDTPPKIPLPWASGASSAYVRVIPKNSQIAVQNGRASWFDGFVPLNFIPISAGGMPPFGSDANGALLEISAAAQWFQAGGPVLYDSSFAVNIGGYPKGAVLASNTTVGLLWISAVDDNATDPDVNSANWIAAPIGNARTRLAGDLTFYVSPTGSDLNNGLSTGTPFLTLQHVTTLIQNGYDLNGHIVTVRIAAGTYSAGMQLSGAIPGETGPTSIVFEAVDGTVTINGSGFAFAANQGAMFSLSGAGFVLGATLSGGAGWAISASGGGKLLLNGVVNFGACALSHVFASTGGQVTYNAGERVSGGAQSHFDAHAGGIIQANSVGVTLVGTPSFSVAYANADECGIIEADAYTTVSGTATGTRYSISTNAVANTAGGGANVFPGNGAGGVATGGQYV